MSRFHEGYVWEHCSAKGEALVVVLCIAQMVDFHEGTADLDLQALARRSRLDEDQLASVLEEVVAQRHVVRLSEGRWAISLDLEKTKGFRLPGPSKTRDKAAKREPRGRYFFPQEQLQRVFDRDGGRCHYCGSRDNLGVDHKLPQSRGGGHEDANLVTCCGSCNRTKGATQYADFIAMIFGAFADRVAS